MDWPDGQVLLLLVFLSDWSVATSSDVISSFIVLTYKRKSHLKKQTVGKESFLKDPIGNFL